MHGPAFIAVAVSLLDSGKTALSPRGPQISPLLSSSSVIHRTDPCETLYTVGHGSPLWIVRLMGGYELKL